MSRITSVIWVPSPATSRISRPLRTSAGMRGECLNLLMTISGNRYGRGLIRPGGVAFDIPDEMAKEIERRVDAARRGIASGGRTVFRSCVGSVAHGWRGHRYA